MTVSPSTTTTITDETIEVLLPSGYLIGSTTPPPPPPPAPLSRWDGFMGRFTDPTQVLIYEAIILFALVLGSFAVGVHVANPCNAVSNKVSYPVGVVRDARDLLWDIRVLKNKSEASWEGRVLWCTLSK